MAIREFRGDFHLSEHRELSGGFGSEYAGGSFRRSETRLSGGLTPFHHPRSCLRDAPGTQHWEEAPGMEDVPGTQHFSSAC